MTPVPARKLGLVPSVSEVMNLLAAPGLEAWKRKTKDYKKVAEETAAWGTECHRVIEQWILTGEIVPEWEPLVMPALDELMLTVALDGLQMEAAFAHSIGFGGRVDAHMDWEDKFVIDFKTKAFDDPKKKLAYPNTARQLAAYRVGLGIPTARMINVFISRTTPGVFQIYEWPEKQTYWNQFYYLLKLWQELHYDSSFGD